MKFIKYLLLFLLGILVGGFLLWFKDNTQQPSLQAFVEDVLSIPAQQGSLDYYQDTYRRFEEVFSLLSTEYFDQAKLNSGAMMEAAIKTYVDSIDDPYTVYMDVEQSSGFANDLKGSTDFEGIGAIVTKKDYYIMIEEIIKDSPAFKAGLKPLDRIIIIDTGSVKNESLDNAVSRIKGPKGTTVHLTIERLTKNGDKEFIEKAIVREQLSVPSVSVEIFTGNNLPSLGYLEISIIGEETDNLLKKEIDNLQQYSLSGIVIDLRGNGGGLLPIAVEIASHFVPKDKVIVSDKYKAFPDEEYTSAGYGELEQLPIVVLIDSMTASAGEIIALALQEQVGAKLIGTTTFGKGSIQTIQNFSDNASLKYTVGKRYAPSGKNVDGVGVTPDIVVEFDMTGYLENSLDNQLIEAKETLIKMIQKL